MMEGWRKKDPTTKKTFPVGIDVLEFLTELGMEKYATEMVKAFDDCAVIAYYYLLQVGYYTVEKQRYKTKQTVQFNLEDAMFFCQNAKVHLRQLPINALEKEILSADGATLKLDH